ncbi:hypothetical protein [uncultured Pseudoramibacter sp.]|uniref:hypothetical protein n=1 Tax=uncultured Pseudoramibacter sp. TaxID=1623493 RepID=UPI0025EF3C5D|nr:hypothetical protein [uncultured Pseudoramibacter sp.]
MTDQKSRRWLLYIFDCIALAVGNFGMLGVSKFVFNAEVRTDLMTVVLFMLCIRLLIVALGDFTGFCDKLWHTVVIVAIEEAAVVIVEYVMVYGLSQRFLIMTAAADLILVMLVHVFWQRRQRKAVPADAADSAQTDTDGEAPEGVLEAEEEAAADEAAAAEDDKDHKVSWLLRGSVLDDADEADEASEASDAADQTEASGSGTALDWLDDDDEDFGSEGSGLFTSEDDDLEEEEDIEDAEAIQQTQEEVPEAVPEQEVNPAQETTPEQEAAPASDDGEGEAASETAEIEDTEQEEPVSEPTTESEAEAPAAETAEAPEREEVLDEAEPAVPETAAPEAEAAAESEDQTAQRDVEDDLNDFIDVLSAEVSDDVYTEVSARLKASLERLLAFRTDEPFVTTSRELIGQLDGTKSKGDLTTAAIDNVIAVAQQIESIDQVENVIEAPAATAEKPVEAHRVKKSDYNIQDDEILLDSGDSEIIISKEDLEHIRNYMKNHRKSK